MAACSGKPCRHSARRSPVPQLSTSKDCPLTSIVRVSIAGADACAAVLRAVRMMGCRAWCGGPCQDQSQTLTMLRIAGRVLPLPALVQTAGCCTFAANRWGEGGAMASLPGVDELFEGRHFDREIIVLCVVSHPRGPG